MTNLDSLLKKQRCYFAKKGLSSQSYGFSNSHVWMLDYKENWVLKNWCFWTVVLEKTLESPLDRKAMQPVSPTGNQYEYALERLCWSWNPNTLATWLEELTHLKRPWCLERLKARGVGDDRGWDGWMTLLTQWTWVWVNSGSRWWTGRPGMLQSMWSERIGHNWATELNYSKEVSGIQWEWYFYSIWTDSRDFWEITFKVVWFATAYMGLGLPWWLGSNESACQCRRLRFIPGPGTSLEKEMATHSILFAWRKFHG